MNMGSNPPIKPVHSTVLDPKRIIEAEAKNLGFSLTGVTTPERPDHFDIFERWLGSGYQADQNYLARVDLAAKRADPTLLMPGCKSIICLAFPYPKFIPPIQKKGWGQLAAYATIPDYHDVIPPLIDLLMENVQSRLGNRINYQPFTDSGPILERDLAQRAGLGWIGRNSCLIHPDHGSNILLAEVLVDLKIKPDQPTIHDRCGSCNRCVEACPTQCIMPERMIDSSRCISYLTIENKNEIPVELRQKLGNWVFGCDICQQVCPWNRKHDENLSEGEIENKNTLIDLVESISISETGFKERFHHSPVLRAKHKGILRNIAIVLGNSGDNDGIPALERQLSMHERPMVRAACAWALGEIAGRQSVNVLQNYLDDEDDPLVQSEIRLALDKILTKQSENDPDSGS